MTLKITHPFVSILPNSSNPDLVSSTAWNESHTLSGVLDVTQTPAVDALVAEVAEDNVYRTLIEGFESFMGLLELGSTEDETDAMNAVTHDGTPYRSMLRGRR